MTFLSFDDAPSEGEGSLFIDVQEPELHDMSKKVGNPSSVSSDDTLAPDAVPATPVVVAEHPDPGIPDDQVREF